MIVSSSLDKTIRVWAVRNAECLRVIRESNVSNCVRFHPTNSALIAVRVILCSHSLTKYRRDLLKVLCFQ